MLTDGSSWGRGHAGTLSSDATAGADGAVGTPVEGSVQRVSYNMLCKSQLTQFCSKRRLPAPVFKLLPPPESSSGPPQVSRARAFGRREKSAGFSR
jgi:hypothetical protein